MFKPCHHFRRFLPAFGWWAAISSVSVLSLSAAENAASPTTVSSAQKAPLASKLNPVNIEKRTPKTGTNSFATTTNGETNSEPLPGRPKGLDSAFDFAPDLGGVRDFLLDKQDEHSADGSQWRQLIVMARKQREMGNYNFAFSNLQEVLDGAAPESFKKTALIEMATTQYLAGQYHEALKTYGIFRLRYPQDAGLPHVLFYQGLLLRELGAPEAALAKFHTVLSSALNLNLDKYQYYRRIVLLAQAQIADTLYTQGRLDEAADKYEVLMKDESTELKHSMLEYRLILCLEGLDRSGDLVSEARTYLSKFPDTPESPHVRYMLATALKKLGRNGEALKEVKALLEAAAAHNSPVWRAWQQRTGNEIANQLYQSGDYFRALELYMKLAEMDNNPDWQLPVWYQIGLIQEHLKSPPEAIKAYQKILDREHDLPADAASNLKTIVQMARWRRDFIRWKFEAEKARIELIQPADSTARTASTK